MPQSPDEPRQDNVDETADSRVRLPSRNYGKPYGDPVDLIWIATARLLGIEIVRDSEVFAAWDGAGVLRLGTQETLDPDDCLAQMILHELCHALVAGSDAMALADWGLEYGHPDHEVFEHAAVRLQAHLASKAHLRDLLASTTDHRSYYEALPLDPLDGAGDPAIGLARRGLAESQSRGWHSPILKALEATRAIRDAVEAFAADTFWKNGHHGATNEPTHET